MHRLIGRLPKRVRHLLKSVPGAAAARDLLYFRPRGEPLPPGSLRPVVYLPTWLEWDVMKQRPQYLMEAFAAAGHEVWFVDPRLPGPSSGGPGVNLVGSLRPVPRSDVILYTHFAPTRSLIKGFERAVIVYDLLDDLSIYDSDEEGMPENRRARHHHEVLVSEADFVIVSNPVLKRRHLGERDGLILVENGVDPFRFTPDGARAAGLPGGTVVGYHGAISPWFDFDLVTVLALSRPALEFVLVGPIAPEVAGRAQTLQELPNVHLYPPQPASRVAGFVRGFDVGIIPFVVDEMTQGVTPLKMYEYMATGVPVVATPLPACKALQAVRVAGDPEEFAHQIDLALAAAGSDQPMLRQEAEKAAWNHRIEPLLDRLTEEGVRIVA